MEIRGVDGLFNADSTPLDLVLTIKRRCVSQLFGDKECWIRSVKARRR